MSTSGPASPSPKRPSRRDFLTGAAGAALAATVARDAQAARQAPDAQAARQEPDAQAARHAPAAQPTRKPLNVLFFMSDDMRTELGCYASRFNTQTPHIDALAATGVRFDRNYCQFPLCNPSRSSLFSGHPPHTTRVLGNSDSVTKLHPDWITLPRLFRDHGYTTLRSGKLFHAGLDDHTAWTDFDGDVESLHPTAVATRLDIPHIQVPRPDGVLPNLPADNERAAHSDQLLLDPGDGQGSGDWMVAERTIANLRACKDKPFFIGCGFSKPHSPPEAPKRFYDLYDASKIQLPPDFAAWPTVPPGFPKAAIRMRNADLFIGRGASPDEARQVIRAYLASISWVDHNLGRVVAELDRLNLRDNTLIVFVADHGYQLGEKGKWSKAGSLFENGTRVPLIVSLPSSAGNGHSCTRIVQSLDIYRTVAELAGLTPPQAVEGTSLVPLLHNPALAHDEPAFSIWSEDGKTVHGTAIRTPQYRYAEFGPAAANGAMLFDVHADPMELTNLADDPQHATARAALSKQIAAYTASA